MQTYRIPEFPQDDEYWMITWVYLVTLHKNDYRLKVDLAAINRPIFESAGYSSASYTHKRHTITIGSSALFLAEVGTIWHQQQLFFSPAHIKKENIRLTINLLNPQHTISTTLYNLSQAFYQLPSYHPFGNLNEEKLSHSFCRVIKAQDFTAKGSENIQFLIFPPSELIRFYYCGSDHFIKQILAGGIPNDDVYRHHATRYNPDTEELFILMRGHLRASDAPYVGRIAGDSIANAEAINLGKDIQRNIINTGFSYLDTNFPFTGPTQLEVTGKWIKTKKSKWAFFVYSIITCTAELPFKSLHYYRENDNRKTKNPVEEKEASKEIIPHTADPRQGAEISSLAEPGSGLERSTLEVLLPANQKFPNLPPIILIDKEQQLETIKGRQPRWYTKLDGYTTGDEDRDSNGNIGPVGTDTFLEEETRKSISFSQFHEITDELRKQKITCFYLDYWNEWAISTVYINFTYPAFLSQEKNKNIKWLFITNNDENITYKRRVVILQITYAGNTFYLIECEARNSESFSRLLIRTDANKHSKDLILNTLLRSLLIMRGTWSKLENTLAVLETTLENLGITKQPIHHIPSESPAKTAKRIIAYLKKPTLGRN